MPRHYVREYRRLVGRMLVQKPRDEAMECAVGGSYGHIGAAEKQLLLSLGLKPRDYLIDVGCGSGRLSYALRDSEISYLGIDVVPELVEYAIEKSGRPDWTFRVVDGLTIPEHDSKADMIVFFSVLTHLSRRESLDYLRDAERALKVGGKIIVSFLDRQDAGHRAKCGPDAHKTTFLNHIVGLVHRVRGLDVKNTLLNKSDLLQWAEALRLRATFYSDVALGQSVCVYEKI